MNDSRPDWRKACGVEVEEMARAVVEMGVEDVDDPLFSLRSSCPDEVPSSQLREEHEGERDRRARPAEHDKRCDRLGTEPAGALGPAPQVLSLDCSRAHVAKARRFSPLPAS